MPSHFRVVLGTLAGIAGLMILILGLHLGGDALLPIGRFSPLLGALIGGTLTLVCVNMPLRSGENTEPWIGRERLGWVLIGCGFIAWFIGESFWRYYVAHGQTPFPSLADLGYSSFEPLVLLGLFFLPASKGGNNRLFLVLDSLVAMGALFAIAWFLLLGPLAQTPAETWLAKFLGLYYPSSDVILLSYVVFLLIREQDSVSRVNARRIGLLLLAAGLTLYASADFLFNVLSNIGVSVDGTWIDLGWPLGIITMGVAAYLRRFSLATEKSVVAQQMQRQASQGFRPLQLLPYGLLGILFIVLLINVLSRDPAQMATRPVLLIVTLMVIALVVVRQVITMLQNERLLQEQQVVNQKLEKVYQDVEHRNAELEKGVAYLKDVQTRLANGDIRARARIEDRDLWPLATGLNLMADRMMRSETSLKASQQILKAVDELSVALENSERGGKPFVLPLICREVPALQRLLWVLGFNPAPNRTARQVPPRPTNTPQTPFPGYASPPSSSPTSTTSPWQQRGR